MATASVISHAFGELGIASVLGVASSISTRSY
jgi:hypothetical protein